EAGNGAGLPPCGGRPTGRTLPGSEAIADPHAGMVGALVAGTQTPVREMIVIDLHSEVWADIVAEPRRKVEEDPAAQRLVSDRVVEVVRVVDRAAGAGEKIEAVGDVGLPFDAREQEVGALAARRDVDADIGPRRADRGQEVGR